MKSYEFNSLGDLLKHLKAELEAAHAEGGQPEQGPAAEPEQTIDDFELRVKIIKYVVNEVGFNSPDEFGAYVQFIYEFLTEGTVEE